MTGIPDADITSIREDFECIWELNKLEVIRETQSETEAGNYGYDDEISTPSTSAIELNIQGVNSHMSKRALQGIITDGKNFKAYAKYDTTLENDDKIKFDSYVFVIKNLNKSFKDGQVAFQDFDLMSVGKQ